MPAGRYFFSAALGVYFLTGTTYVIDWNPSERYRERVGHISG